MYALIYFIAFSLTKRSIFDIVRVAWLTLVDSRPCHVTNRVGFTWPLRLTVRTAAFQAVNRSSILLGATTELSSALRIGDRS